MTIALFLTGQNLLKTGFNLFGGLDRSKVVILFILVAGFIGLYLVLKKKRSVNLPSMLKNQATIKSFIQLPLALALWMFITFLWSLDPDYGFEKATGYIIFCIALPAFTIYVIDSVQVMRMLLWFVFVFSIAQAVQAILLGSTLRLSEIQLYAMDNAESTIELAIGLGRRTGLGLLTGVALFFFAQHKHAKVRFSIVLGCTILLFSLLASVSRGSLLSSLTAITVFIILIMRAQKSLSIVLLVLVMGAVYFFLSSANEFIMYRFQASTVERDADYRISMFIHAFSVFFENPLLGSGAGSWGVLYFGIGVRMYPHNILAENAAELGVPGLLLFFLFLINTGKKAFLTYKRAASSSDFHILVSWAIAFLVLAFVAAQTSGHIARNEWIWFAAAAVFIVRNLQLRSSFRPSAVTPVQQITNYLL